jgi:hypothetical protein
MGKLEAGSRVVCHQRGKIPQLATVKSVTAASADFYDFTGSRALTSPDGLIIIVQLDDGTLVPVPERSLTVADESRPSRVYFTPSASMTRTDSGWTLEVDFADSIQGGELAGVTVEDATHVPEGAAACEALDAAIKRSPWRHEGKLRLFIGDHKDVAEPVLLVWGSPEDGFHFVGPVMPNDPELDSFVDQQLRNVNWWYAPLSSLEDARLALD